MEDSKLFHDRYFLERLLGRGNFSEVWLAKDTKTDIQVALKIYAPATGLDDAGLNVFAREFSLVVNANHKNLLKPLYYDSCDRKPYLVLPYCKQGSIMKQIGKFTEADAWRLLRDVASGLLWLHGMNPPVIHQDIKPDNVMIGENGDFMITDFGVSTHLKSTLRKSMSTAFSSAGTVAYMAPERFSKDNTPLMANDIYSLGATVFEMLSGDTPFGDDGGLVQKKGAEVPDLQGDYSDQLKKVVGKCLKTNPWERPTAEQLEEYAVAGLAGSTIHFVDEKTAWQKYKRLICVIGVLAIVGIAAGGFFMKSRMDRLAMEELAHETQMRNDSIQAKIAALTVNGDSLLVSGDARDEGYENAYLGAYDSYRKAIDKLELLPADMKASSKDSLTVKKQRLELRLQEAYDVFMKKAEMFAEDVEIATEFRDRASRISDAIGLKNLENASEKGK